ncbi:SS18-like protein 2 isoform X1 [Arapaima gigas]
MSVVFVPKKQRGKAQINQEVIQRKGRATECVQYQQILHRNIVYLGVIADASPDVLPGQTASHDNGNKAAMTLPVLNRALKITSPSHPNQP